jgi:beta-1,4-mannosyl-glycoprotein beta-1,4-N-acetylglucosaminyltransferase
MLIDCFIFYNELDILKKRLRYLDSVVDKFVLVESTTTFRGIPKELYYQNNKDMFREWHDKIIHIIVKDNPSGKDPWVREYFQRNCIARGLLEFQDDDIVMVSDVDEIPNRTALRLPPDVPICSYNMIAFQYNFNYIQELEPWFGTVITTKEVLMQVSPQKLREMRWSVPHYKNAGWHLSSFGDEKFIANKVYNFAHCYDAGAKDLDEKKFKELINEGIHTDGKYKLVKTSEKIMNTLPLEIKL